MVSAGVPAHPDALRTMCSEDAQGLGEHQINPHLVHARKSGFSYYQLVRQKVLGMCIYRTTLGDDYA